MEPSQNSTSVPLGSQASPSDPTRGFLSRRPQPGTLWLVLLRGSECVSKSSHGLVLPRSPQLHQGPHLLSSRRGLRSPASFGAGFPVLQTRVSKLAHFTFEVISGKQLTLSGSQVAQLHSREWCYLLGCGVSQGRMSGVRNRLNTEHGGS